MSDAPVVLRAAGLVAPLDLRGAWRAVALALIAYVVGFAIYYPRITTNDDEARYVQQARLMVEGVTQIEKVDPRTGQSQLLEPSQYPPGTAALMAPFVALAGWRAGYLVPLLSLVATILITGRWIAEQQRSPAWALTMLSFPAMLVLGRVAISDVPSAAVCALGLWLFWRGIAGRWPLWLAAGLVAGLSMTLREPNAVVFVCLFAGTVLRREWKCWALVLGGLCGVGLRLLASYWAFGDAFYVKQPYVLGLDTVMERLPIYLLGLLVCMPGGLLFGLAYRGPRRPEIVSTFVLFFVFWVLQPFGMEASAFAKRLVVALRYFVPILPLLAFAMSESAPRFFGWLLQRLRNAPLARTASAAAVGLYFASIVVAAFVVHLAYARWGATQADIRDAILDVTGSETVLVTNWRATRKFIEELDRNYLAVDRDVTSAEEVATLAQTHGELYVALLDRTESDYWRADAAHNAGFIAALPLELELRFDRAVTPTDRLRIWRVTPRGAPVVVEALPDAPQGDPESL